MDRAAILAQKIEFLSNQNKSLREMLAETEKETEKIANQAKEETMRFTQLLELVLPILKHVSKPKESRSIQCSIPTQTNVHEFIYLHKIGESLEKFMDKLNESYMEKAKDEALISQLDENSTKLISESAVLQSRIESLRNQKAQLESSISGLVIKKRLAESHLYSYGDYPAFLGTFDNIYK
ncbi:unnamed protein product [Blepharisma stoltei]|uniref:Uncharacterized protein n=1 Tax=Blepharisma stoltei TaxID=1481888 RepID=A0AAU9JE96_9CILI|nr:unnamed protein product [Blepharisma stoltei]